MCKFYTKNNSYKLGNNSNTNDGRLKIKYPINYKYLNNNYSIQKKKK